MEAFKDNSRATTGLFQLQAYDPNNKLLWVYQDANLVVDAGRSQIARLVGGDVTNRSVNRIGFGSNGSAPVATDTALTTAFLKAVTAVSYPSAGVVKFDFTLELVENNGTTIREFGLICTDGTLLARKTRAAIDKTSSIRLEGSWTITY